MNSLCWTYNKTFGSDDGRIYCNQTSNGVSCWPTTLVGQYAVVQCPQNMHGIDPTKNATRFCYYNGTWAEKANYNSCIIYEDDDLVTDRNTEIPDIALAERIIYNLGFSVSTVALVIALIIFGRFRSLRCLRNLIHSHLIVTFILHNLIWIALHYSLVPIWTAGQLWACKLIVSLFHYAQGTNFFWMLVEGLYLHIIIVWTYSADKIKKWYLLVIGWGIPLTFISIWVVFRIKKNPVSTGIRASTAEECWLPGDSATSINPLDYIYIAPILFVLAVNLFFLGTIIWVLITKLRASNNLETKQLRKAARATVFLLPLLGITYVVLIWPPTSDSNVLVAHRIVNAFLQSFQGFFVALLYCFLNGEVKSVLKKKFSRFQDSRSFSTRKSSLIGMDVIHKDSIPLTNGYAMGSNRPCHSGRDCRDSEWKDCESDRML